MVGGGRDYPRQIGTTHHRLFILPPFDKGGIIARKILLPFW